MHWTFVFSVNPNGVEAYRDLNQRLLYSVYDSLSRVGFPSQSILTKPYRSSSSVVSIAEKSFTVLTT